MIAYVIETSDGWTTVLRNWVGDDVITTCPVDLNGNYITDPDILDLEEYLDEGVERTRAVVSEVKVQAKAQAEALKAQQAAERELIQQGLRTQQVGAQIIAQVWAINESKGLDAQAFQTMMADTTIQNIERLLRNGALLTAKTMIQSLGTEFFTEAEKTAIIASIDANYPSGS